MEVGMRLEGGGIELATALGDDGVEFVQRSEVPIDDRLVQQGPEMFGGLEFGRIGRQEDQADPVGDDQAFGAMPARVVEHEDDAALAPCTGPVSRAKVASSSAKKGLERPLQRYQTASPLVGCTKAARWSHW
jgi:hypothetical protein